MTTTVEIDLLYEPRLQLKKPWQYVTPQVAQELRAQLVKSIISNKKLPPKKQASLEMFEFGSWGILARCRELNGHELDGDYILAYRAENRFYLLTVMMDFAIKNYNSRFLHPFRLDEIGSWEECESWMYYYGQVSR